MKRFFTAIAAAAIFASLPGISLLAQTNGDEAKLIEKAKKIHKDVITLDTHNDINTANLTDTVN